MNPDAANHPPVSSLLRDGAAHGALVILKTASRGDLARGFESHALRLTFAYFADAVRAAAGEQPGVYEGILRAFSTSRQRTTGRGPSRPA